MKEIIITNFRNTLRDAFNRMASERSDEEIYGAGKTKFIADVEADIQKTWDKYLNIEKIYLIGSLDPPPQLEEAINAKVQASQRALQRANEVAEETAKANKIIEAAKGAATSKKLATDAITYDITQQAIAKSQAIKLVQKQLDKSPAYIEYIKANSWDGVLPVYLTAGAPLPMINVTQ